MSREFLLVAHLLLGTLFFCFFVNGLTGFISKSTQRVRILLNGTSCMAIVAWMVVFFSTWIVSPRSSLAANSVPAHWYHCAMAWMAPILATTVAVIVIRYGAQLYRERKVHGVLTLLFIIAFWTAAVAGGIGSYQ